MAKALNTVIGQIGVDDLLADDRDNYIVTTEAIAEGDAFKRGQLVTYDKTNKVIKAITALTDEPFGIVVTDVDSSEGDVAANVYVKGSFNGKSALLDAGVVPADEQESGSEDTPIDIENFYVALRDRGIIIRRDVE